MDFDYLKQKRILLVDDEQELLDMVVSILYEDGFQNIKTAKTVSESLAVSESYQPEFAILDVMLPDGNGFDLMERLKKAADYPVLFLTARGEDDDKFRGFGLGADDYMVKPYAVEELLARIRALSRRPKDFTDHSCLSYLDIRFHPDTRILACQDSEQLLSKRKALLMEFFLRNPDKTLTREQIYSRVWGPDGTVEDGNLDTYIYFLRKHLSTLKSRACIQTVHGMGYRLEEDHVS